MDSYSKTNIPSSIYQSTTTTPINPQNDQIGISKNYYDSNACPYRLPCGLCTKLGYDCPKGTFNTIEITCSSNGGGSSVV